LFCQEFIRVTSLLQTICLSSWRSVCQIIVERKRLILAYYNIHTLHAVKLCQLCHKQETTLPCHNTPQIITVVIEGTERKVNVTCPAVLCVHTRCQNKFHLCNCKATWSWCTSPRSEVFVSHKTSPGLFVLQVCWSTEQAFRTHYVEWEPLNWNSTSGRFLSLTPSNTHTKPGS